MSCLGCVWSERLGLLLWCSWLNSFLKRLRVAAQAGRLIDRNGRRRGRRLPSGSGVIPRRETANQINRARERRPLGDARGSLRNAGAARPIDNKTAAARPSQLPHERNQKSEIGHDRGTAKTPLGRADDASRAHPHVAPVRQNNCDTKHRPEASDVGTTEPQRTHTERNGGCQSCHTPRTKDGTARQEKEAKVAGCRAQRSAQTTPPKE